MNSNNNNHSGCEIKIIMLVFGIAVSALCMWMSVISGLHVLNFITSLVPFTVALLVATMPTN